MIFRLDGTIEETLALTPVIRGWKELVGGELFLDVMYPNLFKGNPFFDGFVKPDSKDTVLDYNRVEWQAVLRPVCESYMEFVFGRQRPSCWRTLMYNDDTDERRADSFIQPGSKVAVISMANPPSGLMEALAGRGYLVTLLTHKDCLSAHVFRAAVNRASLYIGDDGDATAIAMTTDVPAVICYDWRSPVYFTPFRRDIPFVALPPRKEDCPHADGCMMSNGFFELGRTFGVKCPLPEILCKKIVPIERIMEAVGKMEARI
jgi:hypothetical protein